MSVKSINEIVISVFNFDLPFKCKMQCCSRHDRARFL